MQSIHDLLEIATSKFAERTAIDAPDHRLSYAGLAERIALLAGALQSLGVSKGDRVAILAPNCADYLVSQYATSRLGAIFEVLNTRLVTEELVYAVDNAAANALIIHTDCQHHHQALAACPSVNFTIGIAGMARATHSIEALVSSGHVQTAFPELTAADPAVLMYTSGTTGRPKGAIQTQGGSVQADLTTAELLEASHSDKFLAFMPFFHQAGLIRARAMLSRGATNVIADKLKADDIATFLQHNKITMTMLVPPYSSKLLSLCEDQDISLPSLRLMIGGMGARVNEFCRRNHCRSMAVYGQTEVTGLITVIYNDEAQLHPGTVGRAVKDMEIRIASDSGATLPVGETGEIMARSGRCVPGYWHNEQATADLYSSDWLHTGDLGYLDDTGYLHFVNRKKELIKTGGENVYPIEVENVVRKHPQVADMTVIGLRDKTWGEAVTAVLVTNDRSTLTTEDIRQFCHGKLAGYKTPRYVFCIAEVPRNHTGKADKRLLQQQFQPAILTE
jgi:fatty-acyl-CoA synthase